jgi:hypothetical protein
VIRYKDILLTIFGGVISIVAATYIWGLAGFFLFNGLYLVLISIHCDNVSWLTKK